MKTYDMICSLPPAGLFCCCRCCLTPKAPQGFLGNRSSLRQPLPPPTFSASLAGIQPQDFFIRPNSSGFNIFNICIGTLVVCDDGDLQYLHAGLDALVVSAADAPLVLRRDRAGPRPLHPTDVALVPPRPQRLSPEECSARVATASWIMTSLASRLARLPAAAVTHG